MECGECFPSQLFVALTVDKFFWHSGGLLERKKQDSHVYQNNWHITSNFSEKLESSLYKQQSLRDHEKAMEFLTCDRCEDEYK